MASDVSRLRMRLLVAVGVLSGTALHNGARADEVEEIVCVPQTVNGACPDQDKAVDSIFDKHAGRCPSIIAPAEEMVEGCCYEVTFDCSGDAVGCNYSGRPLLVRGVPVAGETARIDGWKDDRLVGVDASALSPRERRLLADHWMRIGAAEYGSVAGFYRFAMDLMANGAPHDLVLAAHRAAADEIRHARLAFTLASEFARAPIGPGPLRFPDAVPIHGTLEELALATIEEGCTIETLSACMLREALSVAEDRAVQNVLRKMVRDEDRHAELAWRTLRWALDREPGLRVAARARFDAAIDALDVRQLSADANLGAYGLLAPTDATRCLEQTVKGVIRPCAAALLSGESRV